MLEQNDSLALAALVVALVALLNSVLQVLQQYFATADGYRRCSPSVIGQWARLTQRRFIFRELRFETVFASPFIRMVVAYDVQELQKVPEAGAIAVLDGSEEMSNWPGLQSPSEAHGYVKEPIGEGQHQMSWPKASGIQSLLSWASLRPSRRARQEGSASFGQRSRTRSWRCEEFMHMDRDPASDTIENEPVSWISLLQSLQAHSATLRSCGLVTMQDTSTGSLRHGRVLAPTLRLSKKSWDFVPPEVLKPYAVTTVRDIAIMAQLLGLRWTIFNPEEGMLRAEGNGSIITSFQIRPLGTMVSFLKTGKQTEHRRKLHRVAMSPLEGATALGFGIIHSHFVRDYQIHKDIARIFFIYSKEDCKDTLLSLCSNAASRFEAISKQTLETSEPTFNKLTIVITASNELCIVMTDILGFLTPVLRVNGTSITYIAKPSLYISPDVASTRSSFFEFFGELVKRKLNGKSRRSQISDCTLSWIYQISSRLAKSNGWEEDLGRPRLTFRHHTRSAVLELLQLLHFAWERTDDFLARRKTIVQAIMNSHLSAMLEMDSDSLITNLQPGLPSRYVESAKTARTKMMDFYFNVCCHRCVEETPEITGKLPDEIEEIWVALMFHSICWHALHNIDDRVVAVPPRYYDSHLPIYIS